ncbi:MAG: hemerythrin domain-containing protein [Acidobacteriia bacterium]|jgi:hemerythrin-like domain-containing protein|nr:hemerythrin domain-containing protein [Terriglobia bacterium]
MSRACVAHLQEDHTRFAQMLATLEGWVQKAESAMPAEAAQWQQARTMLESFIRDVTLHISKEEQVLFPVLEAYLPRDIGPLAVLRGEHSDIRAQFRRLQEAIVVLCREPESRHAAASFARAGHALRQLVYDHLYKEDRVLYPMIARFLEPERDAHLLQQMQALHASAESVAPETLKDHTMGSARSSTEPTPRCPEGARPCPSIDKN